MSLHPPIPLLYLAGVLGDYAVTIYDQRVDGPEKFNRSLAQNPLCVGFSIFTGQQIKFALELAETVKERGLVTVFGGVHATILPEQTQADRRVDYVVAGDGEYAFRELVDSLAGGRASPPVIHGARMEPDLDELPALPYNLVDVENYVHCAAVSGRSLPFLFSRGCPYKCSFCCNPVISKSRWRRMSVDRAVEQMDALVEMYNLEGIFFLDENLTSNAAVLKEMAERINGRYKWYAQARADSLLQYDLSFLEKMGAVRFGCGLESGSPRVLEKINKKETVEQYVELNRRLAQTNINVAYNYITGYPFETLDELKLTITLALQMLDENPRANNNTFYLLTPYPGTQIGASLKAQMPDRLEDWARFDRHNYSAKWHKPATMKLYQRIGFSSKFVGRRLTNVSDGNGTLRQLAEVMTDKWRRFDFYDDDEWEQLHDSGWRVLRELFGENAY